MRNLIILISFLLLNPSITQSTSLQITFSNLYEAEGQAAIKRYGIKLLNYMTMTYTSTLNGNQKKVAGLIIKRLNELNVKNRYIQAAILSIVSKETNFTPVSEYGYSNTTNQRIRNIFGVRVSQLSEELLTQLKSNDEAFFNMVYGGLYGNLLNEGYKYRGRGLNGVTFKGNYKAMQKYTKVDIINNPDNLNQIEVAVEILIGYFLDNFSKGTKHLKQYNMTSIHDAASLEDAIGAIYHANAGWGQSLASIKADSTGGRKKAFDRGFEMLVLVDYIND